jgi:hypothetical protein
VETFNTTTPPEEHVEIVSPGTTAEEEQSERRQPDEVSRRHGENISAAYAQCIFRRHSL